MPPSPPRCSNGYPPVTANSTVTGTPPVDGVVHSARSDPPLPSAPIRPRHESEERPVARRLRDEEVSLPQPRDQARVAPRLRRPHELRRRRVTGEAGNVAPV